jgi:trehalose-phosphatase
MTGMRALTPHADVAAFHDRLERARERVLMLDYDGTLAPFRVRPEQAVPYPGVTEILAALTRQADTRVVVVSGRRAAEVAALLKLARPPEIWGSHGWERISPDGEARTERPDDRVSDALSRAEASVAEYRREGARFERKPASIALHWRGLPALTAARLRERVSAAWSPYAEAGVLEPLPFDGGIELRAPGATKRRAVETVLAETAPDAPVAYLGDDITDEDAFRTVKPRGLAVLVRAELRDTAADLWIRPPYELLEFLGRWRREAKIR